MPMIDPITGRVIGTSLANTAEGFFGSIPITGGEALTAGAGPAASTAGGLGILAAPAFQGPTAFGGDVDAQMAAEKAKDDAARAQMMSVYRAIFGKGDSDVRPTPGADISAPPFSGTAVPPYPGGRSNVGVLNPPASDVHIPPIPGIGAGGVVGAAAPPIARPTAGVANPPYPITESGTTTPISIQLSRAYEGTAPSTAPPPVSSSGSAPTSPPHEGSGLAPAPSGGGGGGGRGGRGGRRPAPPITDLQPTDGHYQASVGNARGSTFVPGIYGNPANPAPQIYRGPTTAFGLPLQGQGPIGAQNYYTSGSAPVGPGDWTGTAVAPAPVQSGNARGGGARAAPRAPVRGPLSHGALQNQQQGQQAVGPMDPTILAGGPGAPLRSSVMDPSILAQMRRLFGGGANPGDYGGFGAPA